MKLVLTIIIATLLAACAPLTTTEQGRAQTGGAGPDMAEQTGLNPAVLNLLTQAQQQLNAGNADAAAATTERALRIAPTSVTVYQALARIRLVQNDTWQAEALALKANSLAVGHPKQQAENWSIIAKARRQRGDMMGADAAARAAAVLRMDMQ